MYNSYQADLKDLSKKRTDFGILDAQFVWIPRQTKEKNAVISTRKMGNCYSVVTIAMRQCCSAIS